MSNYQPGETFYEVIIQKQNEVALIIERKPSLLKICNLNSNLMFSFGSRRKKNFKFPKSNKSSCLNCFKLSHRTLISMVYLLSLLATSNRRINDIENQQPWKIWSHFFWKQWREFGIVTEIQNTFTKYSHTFYGKLSFKSLLQRFLLKSASHLWTCKKKPPVPALVLTPFKTLSSIAA